MKSRNITLYKVQVSHYADSEKSFAVLVDKGIEAGSWSRKEWFPKSLCTLEKVEDGVKLALGRSKAAYYLTAPKWLLEVKKVKHDEGDIIQKPRGEKT